MAVIIANGNIRIGILCFSMFLYCSLPSHGASTLQPPDQPTASDKKESPSVSPSTKTLFVKSPVKNEKKRVPKEGVKDTHIGLPPQNSPPIQVRTKRLPATIYKNPVDVSTGQELIPVVK